MSQSATPVAAHAPVITASAMITAAGGGIGLGTVLSGARRARGLSQRQVAEALCRAAGADTVSRHEVSRWERGVRLPSGYWLVHLASVLQIDAARLTTGAGLARARRAATRHHSASAVTGWPWRILTSAYATTAPPTAALSKLAACSSALRASAPSEPDYSSGGGHRAVRWIQHVEAGEVHFRTGRYRAVDDPPGPREQLRVRPG